jgi:hypothetical protein
VPLQPWTLRDELRVPSAYAKPADFGAEAPPRLATEDAREKLRAEADSEDWNLRLNGTVEQTPLALKPWHRIIESGGRRSERDDEGKDFRVDLGAVRVNPEHVRADPPRREPLDQMASRSRIAVLYQECIMRVRGITAVGGWADHE